MSRRYWFLGNEIKSRMKFLLDFLDLPSADRVINKLSGGQKRRVSLAVAMLHSPEVSSRQLYNQHSRVVEAGI